MKRIVLLILLVQSIGHFVAVNAQISTTELINDYVEAKIKQQDVVKQMSRLRAVFSQRNSNDEKNVFRTDIYMAIKNSQEKGLNKETLALIELYESFADIKDKNLSLLYYIKGDIYAEQEDTIGIKECIKDLQILSSTDVKAKEYASNLTQSLNNICDYIRNYVPVLNRMEGIWISTNAVFMRSDVMAESYPCYIINVETKNGKPQLRMLGAWGVALKQYDHPERTYAQQVIDIKHNKLLAIWSSEYLYSPDSQETETFFKYANMAGDAISSSIFSGNNDEFLNGLGTELLSAGIMSFLSKTTAPDKTIYILECELKKLNEYELVGTFKGQYVYAKTGEEPIHHSYTETVLFTKWDKRDDLFFISQGNASSNTKYAYYPDIYDKNNNWADFRISKKAEDTPLYKKYSRLIKNTRSSNYRSLSTKGLFKGMKCFNYMQASKMFYNNEQRMIREGITLNEKYHFKNHTILGCSFGTSAEKGVLITDVDTLYPAFLYSIMKDDILLSIDGFEVNSPEEATSYIKSLVPFTTVKLQIIRKGKEKEIPVELSYKIVTE